jgi:hypothetical protein
MKIIALKKTVIMEDILTQAWTLKQNLIDFVLDAEGELAVALEAYAADRASRERYDIAQQNQVIDSFTVEGRVGEKTPIELFVESDPDLNDTCRKLLEHWRLRSFTGLFEIVQIFPDGFELMNWLTAKRYNVDTVWSSDSDGEIGQTKIGSRDRQFQAKLQKLPVRRCAGIVRTGLAVGRKVSLRFYRIFWQR